VLPIALAVLLILAAGAFGLSRVLGSSSDATPAATGAPSGPMAWLGMQIESLTPAGVVIATVAPGSPAERAGLDPGDIIVEVNNQPVNSTSDVTQAIGGLRPGEQVQIEVSRGSTVYSTAATLTAPPANYP